MAQIDNIPESNGAPAQPQNGDGGSSFGAIFAIIIVIALLIIGTVYVWRTRLNGRGTPVPPAADTATDAVTRGLQTQSTSTDPADIEKDLLNTNVDDLDKGLGSLLDQVPAR